jgi:hypothetical protein
MLLQALAEPGSVQLDPQLQKFIQGVRVEIDLGETEGLDAKQREALEGALGEDIFSDGDDKTSINFTKLYGLKRKGTHSHLELQMGKKKSENDMVTLSVVSGIVGEDLSVMRVFQSIILTMQNGHEMASNPQIIKAVGIADEIFDVMAALAKKATSSKNEISSVGRLIQFSQNTGANIIRLPSFTYDWIASFSKSTYGKKMINAVQNFEFLQNGNFMAWLTLAAVTVETVTATVEYQYLNTKTEKRELIVETAARLFSFPIYFLPYVGQVAIGIDASHALFDTSWESADIYRQITKYAIKRKLRQYGFNETTLLLNGLEFEYDIPRNDIKFVLHGSNIKTLDEAMKRQVLLNKEISNTTKNNLVLLYRAHRELKRGANMDFGRKVHNYTDSYKSNIQTYLRVSKEILTAMETLPLNISKL